MLNNNQSQLLIVVTLLLCILCASNLHAATKPVPFLGVNTAAGSNSVGDGAPPYGATFVRPISIQFVSNGDAFIADSQQYTIRKVSNGIVSTIAGKNIVKGDSGDGTPAITALLSGPSQLLVTNSGELIFIDGSPRIKKIDKNGYLTCIAGNGTNILPDGYPAKDSTFTSISSLAQHPITGEIYFSETGNHTIRRISTNGLLYTVAGTGDFGFSGDGGLAINAQLFYPKGIAFSSAGELHISDNANNRIRKIDKNGIISTVVGGDVPGFAGDEGPASQAFISGPDYLAFNPISGELTFLDTNNYRIRKISNKGIISTIVGNGEKGINGDGGLAVNSQMSYSVPISYSPKGELYIADEWKNRIRKVSLDGIISTYAGKLGDGYDASTYGNLFFPKGVSITSSGDLLIADTTHGLIRKLSNGVLSTIITKTPLGLPTHAIARPNGEIYFADSNRIQKISTDGTVVNVVGNGEDAGFEEDGAPAHNITIPNLGYFDFTSKGEIVYTDLKNQRVRKVDLNGIVFTLAGITAGPNNTIVPSFSGDGGLAVDAGLASPFGIVISPSDEIYFVDQGNFRIRKILTNGTIITIAGNGVQGYAGDNGWAVDAKINPRGGLALSSKGDFYFTDNYRIRKVFANGKITTLGGLSYGGFSGDGGVSTSGVFDAPLGIAVDSNDNLYIADVNNNRVRKIGMMCSSPYAFSGSECIPTCFGVKSNDANVCSGRGSCGDVNNCTCQANYYGTNCELYNCYGISKNSSQVCSSHGSCSALNQCSCQSGYSGNTCNAFSCAGVDSNSTLVCSSRGSCNSPNICSCQSNYFGANCESFNCKGIANTNSGVCSGRGSCTAPETCKCTGKAYGANCEFVLAVSNSVVPRTTSLTGRLNQGTSLTFSLLSILASFIAFLL